MDHHDYRLVPLADWHNGRDLLYFGWLQVLDCLFPHLHHLLRATHALEGQFAALCLYQWPALETTWQALSGGTLGADREHYASQGTKPVWHYPDLYHAHVRWTHP